MIECTLWLSVANRGNRESKAFPRPIAMPHMHLSPQDLLRVFVGASILRHMGCFAKASSPNTEARSGIVFQYAPSESWASESKGLFTKLPVNPYRAQFPKHEGPWLCLA